jgi:putative tryptophan/tyrosine transport system substrate-binding protein
MRRRPVLAGLAAILASAPAYAQGQGPRRIGVLMGYSEDDPGASDYITALTQGLNARGWKLGGNIEIVWRWAKGMPALFERNAVELVALKPDALLAQGTPSVKALKGIAGSIPIVFTIVTDPVGQGMVESLAHPGGTVTGFTDFDPAMAGKWMELLSQVTPKVSRVAALFNPETAPFAAQMIKAIEQAAPSFGITATAAPCRDEAAIEAALGAHDGAVALPDLFNLVHRRAIVAAAARHRVPVIYFNRTFTAADGLMSYGVDYADQFKRAAGYFDRLLKGTSVADLPVQQPAEFDLTVNLRTAKALGIELPQTMISVADEVIE